MAAQGGFLGTLGNIAQGVGNVAEQAITSPIGAGADLALQGLAAANKAFSPIKGDLWSGTPISNMILGQPAYAAGPTPSSTSNSSSNPSNTVYGPSSSYANSSGSGSNATSGNSGGGSGPGYAGNTQNQTVAGPNGGSYRWTGSNWVYQQPSGVDQYGNTAADIQAINNAYNKAQSDLQAYVPMLQNQAQNSQQAVQNSLQDTLNQANSSEGLAKNQANEATGELNQNLKSSLGGNRSYAASFGSGLSSFGQGLQNQTYQTFGNQMGKLQGDLATNLNSLEAQKVSAQNWAQQQIAGIGNNLQQGLKQVALNSDLTDADRAKAISDIQSQAQSQINSIQGIYAQIGANIASAQAQATSYAAAFGNYNQNFVNNIGNIMNQGLGFANNQLYNQNPTMNGMYGSNVDQNLYGSNVPNQNPYLTGQ